MNVIRCPYCRTSSTPVDAHEPGSWECMQVADERREAHSDGEA